MKIERQQNEVKNVTWIGIHRGIRFVGLTNQTQQLITWRDMVKCELRVANASCELLMFCELRVTSCTYCASYELRVELIMRVTSCELNERCELETQKCELETQKCELKPKVRVTGFLFVGRPFSSNKKVF